LKFSENIFSWRKMKESDGILENIYHLLKWNPQNYLFIYSTNMCWYGQRYFDSLVHVPVSKDVTRLASMSCSIISHVQVSSINLRDLR
jgi:hypothetical protein